MTVLENVLIVARSGNTKTGPIPASYRTMATCPSDCAFLPTNNGGCYGSGRIFGIANRGAKTLTVEQAITILNKAERGAKYMRDRVVGDLVTPDGKFDLSYVRTIAKIATKVGLIPYGYSHAWRLMRRRDVVAVEKSGYVLNASCETRADIEQATALGLPTVVTGDDWVEGEMIAGRRLVTCPAQSRKNITCADCGLCAKPQRACTVRFLLHGPTRMAGAAIARRNAA